MMGWKMDSGNVLREVALVYHWPHGHIFDGKPITDPAHVAGIMRRAIVDHTREHAAAIYLDGRHVPIAWRIVSSGTAQQTLIHPREVFQPAIHLGACSVILAHNHPSGSLQPSQQDWLLADRLTAAGELLGIAVLDSVIWTEDAFVSMRGASPDCFKKNA